MHFKSPSVEETQEPRRLEIPPQSSSVSGRATQNKIQTNNHLHIESNEDLFGCQIEEIKLEPKTVVVTDPSAEKLTYNHRSQPMEEDSEHFEDFTILAKPQQVPQQLD